MNNAQQQKIDQYIALLMKWNKAYNLTSIRDEQEVRIKHIADSLAVNEHLKGKYIVDVGTGGGLPGIPLAIMNPEKQFTLLDSNSKKTRFLTQVKHDLKLENVTVAHSRVEAFISEELFDCVLTRAFSSLENMLNWSGHLIKPEGEFLAMKGVFPEEELVKIPTQFEVNQVTELNVDQLDSQRHLVSIRKILLSN